MVKITCTLLKPLPDAKFGSPCTRSSHGLSAVNRGSRLILHGGEHVARTPLEDKDATWAADLDATTDTWQWRRILPEVTPPARVAHAQAECEDRVYVFGGRAGITMEEKPMNDLWELDASGEPETETWTLVEPSEQSGPPPQPRSFHRMVCIGKSLYVFGGCGANGRMADLYRFDLDDKTWHNMGASLLRGRGGANLITLSSERMLAVVAGFCGEESNDGQRFNLVANSWDENLLTDALQGMRPRSVCVSGSFPSVGVSLIFGGEVDPSERGHEGAGGFENDVVILQEDSGKYLETIKASSSGPWPEKRGWSDGASLDDGNGTGHLFIFGGLSGDDSNPSRLDDLWRVDVQAD